ncbi:TPM domain-containing protein [Flavobacterium sp.]|uniref:TPM domain-containing protein n=1 Tax=Flavobacterium sp. TaxID=239 RepID=UPI0026390438|nr:TPM domain-containing protein [Flavobacterium sp.]MDD3005292.1 TPM domain-containing protein [Flavobacterium sp.]
MLKHLKSKKILVGFVMFFFWNFWASAQYTIPEIPTLQTSVYDYANLLEPNQKKALEEKLIRYSDTTTTQIVTVIIPSLQNEDKAQLATRWAHTWGIGQAKEDNGVLILLALKEKQIQIVNGYGVEDRLTAGITGDIIRTTIIPYFKQKKYYEGLDHGADEIFKVLQGKYKGERKANQSEGPGALGIIIVLIFIIIFIAIASKRGGGSNNGRGGGGGLDLSDIIILSSLGRSSGGFGGFGQSGGGGGFSGGGFGGGFGGGGFSGGGAGGSW